MNEILDMMDKEEILETEEKIEKVLKKEQVQRQIAKDLKASEDFAESEAKFLLKDNAEELEKKNEANAKKVSFNRQTKRNYATVET